MKKFYVPQDGCGFHEVDVDDKNGLYGYNLLVTFAANGQKRYYDNEFLRHCVNTIEEARARHKELLVAHIDYFKEELQKYEGWLKEADAKSSSID
jgi:hypothetical protein